MRTRRHTLKSWQLTPREYWRLFFPLWLVGSVLAYHYLIGGYNDLGWILFYLASAVVSYGIVIACRFIPRWHKHRL